jgi:phosphate starvation-inducible PhoH-like protein
MLLFTTLLKLEHIKMARKKRQNDNEKPEAIKQRLRKVLKPKTKNQVEYIKCMADSDITFCSGPAGSGKTAVAVGLACEYLLSGKIEKIIITRPVVESGRGLGYLPGTLTEKILPYLIPTIEEMKLYLNKDTFNMYKAQNLIELCPLEYMRGRNFHDSFMILDEAQNATYEQIKMFLTRIGMQSKAVINGDITQTDLDERDGGGLNECMDRLRDIDGVSMCFLTAEDIVRNKIISKIISRL